MSYLIAVLPDRMAAEAAYSALEQAGFPLERLHLLGRGYKTADEFGLIDPAQAARRQMQRLAIWLVPFGFLAGVGLTSGSGDALAYRNRLSAGKYILIVEEESETRLREATRILRQFEPENLQGYSERL